MVIGLLTADEYSIYIKTLPALTKNDDHAYRRLKSQVHYFKMAILNNLFPLLT
jgi:hypothetical protein